MVTCGRLMVDTYVSSKELIRETNYELGNLAQKQLKTTRQDFDDDMLLINWIFKKRCRYNWLDRKIVNSSSSSVVVYLVTD